jgi:hypothetical protein
MANRTITVNDRMQKDTATDTAPVGATSIRRFDAVAGSIAGPVPRIAGKLCKENQR